MITPQEKQDKLAKALGIKNLYLKREDLHPYGSHKGRSIPYMINHYIESGNKKFAISSSGNAALSAIMHINYLNSQNKGFPYSLEVYIGNNIKQSKLEILKANVRQGIRLLIKERPLQALFNASNEGLQSLRQSNDDNALIGYQELAKELLEIGDLGAIFIGTSSGTTAQALAEFFAKNNTAVQIHIIQTSSCHKIIDAFGPLELVDERSIADAIVDQIGYRKEKLLALIEKSKGLGWYASNENIISAQKITKKYTDLDISENSALSIAGAMQAVYTNHKINGSIVCIIGGR